MRRLFAPFGTSESLRTSTFRRYRNREGMTQRLPLPLRKHEGCGVPGVALALDQGLGADDPSRRRTQAELRRDLARVEVDRVPGLAAVGMRGADGEHLIEAVGVRRGDRSADGAGGIGVVGVA